MITGDAFTEESQEQISQFVDILGTTGAPKTLARSLQPHLERLAAQTGEATGLAVPDSYAVQYVTQVESPTPVQVRDYSGLSLPMHVGPSGLVMMSKWPLELIQHYLMRPLEAFTQHTVTSPPEILERLDRFRAAGYGWVYEEFAEGINSVAAPVFGPNGVVAALRVHGPTYRFPNPDRSHDIGLMVADAAARLSAQLQEFHP